MSEFLETNATESAKESLVSIERITIESTNFIVDIEQILGSIYEKLTAEEVPIYAPENACLYYQIKTNRDELMRIAILCAEIKKLLFD